MDNKTITAAAKYALEIYPFPPADHDNFPSDLQRSVIIGYDKAAYLSSLSKKEQEPKVKDGFEKWIIERIDFSEKENSTGMVVFFNNVLESYRSFSQPETSKREEIEFNKLCRVWDFYNWLKTDKIDLHKVSLHNALQFYGHYFVSQSLSEEGEEPKEVNSAEESWDDIVNKHGVYADLEQNEGTERLDDFITFLKFNYNSPTQITKVERKEGNRNEIS